MPPSAPGWGLLVPPALILLLLLFFSELRGFASAMTALVVGCGVVAGVVLTTRRTRIFLVLPKRGAQDPADVDRLRGVLDRNLRRL
ncbi:hypothetical protein [Streptomyces sp. R41]|uniref:Uncharacterized protein n=1 Tax=Streptomyces sp. R41 TaxID=3238632 RepID=A0AB39RK49_9ACTN